MKRPKDLGALPQTPQGASGQSILPTGGRLRRRLILAVLTPLDLVWQTHMHAFAGTTWTQYKNRLCIGYPMSTSGFSYQKFFPPQERMLLHNRGAGDGSPAGAVGQSPTVLRGVEASCPCTRFGKRTTCVCEDKNKIFRKKLPLAKEKFSFPNSQAVFSYQKIFPPQERTLLHNQGAGDSSPAGAVGQSPTVLGVWGQSPTVLRPHLIYPL